MNRLFLLAFLPVFGCTANEIATSASAAQTACADALAVVSTAQSQAKGGALNTVNSIAPYVTATCPVVNGVATVVASAAADPTTAEFLGQLAGEISAVTK
jgi:hypothetical protein